jgi:hypothetical protein
MESAAAEGALLSFGLVLEVAGLEVMIPTYTVYCCYLQQAATIKKQRLTLQSSRHANK